VKAPKSNPLSCPWNNYSHLIQHHLSASDYDNAEKMLSQFENRYYQRIEGWTALEEVEYWVVKTEVNMLGGTRSECQSDIDNFPFYTGGPAEWPEALVDVFLIYRRVRTLPESLSNRISLLEILLEEKRGCYLDLLERVDAAASAVDSITAAKMLLAAGRSATNLGRPVRAELYFRRALSLAGRSGSAELQASALTHLAHHQERNQGILEATNTAFSAIDFFLRSGRLAKAAELRLQIARLQVRQGLLLDALRSIEMIRGVPCSQLSPPFELSVALDHARLCNMLEQSAKARRYLLAVVRKARSTEDPVSLVSALGLLSVTYTALALSSMASVAVRLADRLVRVVPLTPEQRASYQLDVSTYLLESKQHEAALRRISNATQLAESVHLPELTVKCRRIRAELLIAKQKWRPGVRLLQEVVREYEQMSYPYERAKAEVSLGKALQKLSLAADRTKTDTDTQDPIGRTADQPDPPGASVWLRRGLRRLDQIGVPTNCDNISPQGSFASLTPAAASCRRPSSLRVALPKNRWAKYGIVTEDRQFQTELLHMSRVAKSPLPILIRGETGAGKELVAKAIHTLSSRPGRFTVFNSATCGNDLFEAELFGHRKGSFTGAWRDREGLVVQAAGGTLFLDEIADLGHSAQSSLLRFLDSGEVRPVGSDTIRHVDVRIVSASYRGLAEMVEDGRFRRDLFFRLAGTELQIPPLRARRQDILLLINYFAKRAKIPADKLAEILADGFDRRLLSYSWPGNVRQLSHWVTQLAALQQGDLSHAQIVELMKRAMTAVAKGIGYKTTVSSEGQKCQRPALGSEELIALLSRHKGNISRIAQELQTYRTHVYRLIKLNNLDHKSYRNADTV